MNPRQKFGGDNSLHSSATRNASNLQRQRQTQTQTQQQGQAQGQAQRNDSMQTMPPRYMDSTPPRQASALGMDTAIVDSYNDGNGFTPFPGSTRGGALFQSTNGASSNANANANGYGSSGGGKHNKTPPRYSANGGDAAGRSCLVIPSFGSGRKKKKPAKKLSPNKTSPKRRGGGGGGGLFGRGPPSSAASTSAESSMGDPFVDGYHHNDKRSLLESFAKKADGNHAKDWYLETMVEEDEDEDTATNDNSNAANSNSNSNSHSHSNRRTQQFQPREQHSATNKPYSQFVQPKRQQHRDENSASSGDAVPTFLQMPKAEDRSHQARARQDKMHAYEGEMEPEGVRGQEAKAVADSESGSSRKSQPFQRLQPMSTPPAKQPVMAVRKFTNSGTSTSESSSQLLPIRQVVSNSRKQPRDSLLVPQKDEENQEYEDDHLFLLENESPLKPPPGYTGNRTTFASTPSATPGDLTKSFQSPDPYRNNGDDEYSEDINSQNRDDVDKRYRQEDDSRSLSTRSMILEKEKQKEREVRALFAAEQKETNQNGYSGRNNGRGEVKKFHNVSPLSTPSRSQRRSAPVSVDDASFENPLEHIQGINAMAMEHVTKGEFDMALQAFTQVLDVYIQQHGEAHPLTASAHHNLGTVHTKRAGLLPEHTLHQRHCREQALKCFQAAARSARDCPSLGPNHPNVAVSLVRIGFLLLQSRQYRNAVITFEEALRIRTENYGPTHALVANLYNNLGVCHMHLQNFRDGRTFLQQALDIQKELLGQGEDDSTALLELADTLCNIGGLNLEWIRRQGPDARRALDAESAFLEALELRSKVLGEDHVLTTQVRSLHDMVRSIPMPKSAEKPKESLDRTPSWSSPNSTNQGKIASYRPEYSPAAISDMTTSEFTTSKHSGHTARSRNVEANADTSRLDLPVLRTPNRPPDSRPPLDPNKVYNFNDGYDATEESCVLRKPAEDGETASQVGGFVSYAQSTVSIGSGVESDRIAMMKHAKNVLDSHQDFMDSPNVNSRVDASGIERTIDERDGNANEDGLAPLAGDWPGSRDTSRLSPDCLQNPSRNLHTIHNCAAAYISKGRYNEAVTLLEMVVECQKTRNGELHPDVGSAVHNVGIAYLRMEEHYDAFQAFEEAVRVRKATLGREHPEVAVSLVKFGIALMLLQRHEDALWIFRDALSIRKQTLGDLHPSNARIYNNIGCVHVELGNLRDARKEFESALDIQRNTLIQNPENGPMIFGASTTLQNLGYLYGKSEMYEKAAMVLRESLSLQEKIMYPEHPTVLATLESLAETCLDAQRFTHALKYFRELFDRTQSMDSMDCVKQAQTLYTISTIYGQLDDTKEQKKKLEMALRFSRSEDVRLQDGNLQERLTIEKKIQGDLEMVKGKLRSKNNWV